MIGCIVQARMGSSRLPGKVMKKIGDKFLLDYVLEQLQSSKKIEKLFVATTTLSMDDVICNHLSSKNISFFRGSANDVLDRYVQCAKNFSIDTIIRITADNPLIDPNIVDLVIEKFQNAKCDYATNCLPRTFPYGTEVEIFSFEKLHQVWLNAKKPSEREHVTPYFYNHPELFKIANLENSKNISNLRWTVDRKNDLKLVQTIIEKINHSPILLEDILNLYSQQPKLFEQNKPVIQNEGYVKSLKNDEEFFKNNALE
jgi:spore coat polysaccharide biosynthesis protein SpsF